MKSIWKGVKRMYMIKISDSFDAAHFLKGYEGKCSNIHGHRWQVDVEFMSDKLIETGSQKGMVNDFSEYKDTLRSVLKKFDHTFIVESGSIKDETLNAIKSEGFQFVDVDFRTTAENFSRYFFDEIKKSIKNIYSVTVFETPNNSATYKEVNK